MKLVTRRWFAIGASAMLAAPSIVRASALMPVSVLDPLIINPPDFWMQPSEVLEIEGWKVGWWSPRKGAHESELPTYQDVEVKRVPRHVREANKGVFVVRDQETSRWEHRDNDKTETWPGIRRYGECGVEYDDRNVREVTIRGCWGGCWARPYLSEDETWQPYRVS